MLLSVAAVTWHYVDRIDYYFDRNRLAGEQLDSVIRMSAAMNRYSENVAELLLMGRTELNDFNEARDSLESSLDRLDTLIRDEMEIITSPEDRESEQIELERVAVMRSLYEDIDRRTQYLLMLRDQGRLDEAIQIFREEIEDSLDTTLEVHINDAITDEEAELRLYQSRTNRLERELEWIISIVTASAFIISAIGALLLARSLTRPIAALEAATREIGDGNLAHRLDYRVGDEFGSLAAQINNAASRLEAQRSSLLEIQAGLENEVSRRTGQLEEANHRLQKLDHMRMLFLADIGHELRTPLTVLRGEAEIALRGGCRTVEEHRDTLDRIVHLSAQMTRLVEDLLFLARAEVDAIRFDMQPLDLRDLLEIAMSDAAVLAKDSGVQLEAQVVQERILVNADAGRLTQAMLIALDNAIKYADPDSTVHVALTTMQNNALFVVRNLGPEIPAAELPFVFSRFYRARQTMSGAQSGSGLGLSIAKWIVEGHGGRVAISSGDHMTELRIQVPVSS
ncbi:His Kinase A (phospho-acceptor) domain-containing protein [Paracoccus laeviglucosivorans]|uniref:histidine kinase n=2 Tax=Paracoccus laeviglucosivorans TaxID=1197861 RepID=A0A521EQ98_9RHOB|nr:His Kinase A (phospho-acceptor) domain-containing protein [Paracoccus laeviglucosivorans]